MPTPTAAHFPGNHCASTGIRNLVNFHGLPWSEPLCFGIGAGLGIWYMAIPKGSPSRMLHVRSADIEQQFFSRIGCRFTWELYNDPAEAERALCRRLDQGIPAILQSDIYHLPYYNSSTHFPGHVITAWDYDADRQVFWVTDTERTELLPVPFEAMRRARFCEDFYFSIKGNCYALEAIDAPQNLDEIIRQAILYNARVLLDEKTEFQGIGALKKWLSEIPAWEMFGDWKWTARFAYQVIEKRGTGGGGFRKMYARFLEEAADLLPGVQAAGLVEQMNAAARAWTALAESLKTVSDGEEPDFSEVYDRLTAVIQAEQSCHVAAETALSGA